MVQLPSGQNATEITIFWVITELLIKDGDKFSGPDLGCLERFVNESKIKVVLSDPFSCVKLFDSNIPSYLDSLRIRNVRNIRTMRRNKASSTRTMSEKCDFISKSTNSVMK